MKKILIIVDVLRGFVNKETEDGICNLYLPGADVIIPNIEREMKKADGIIFVCDTHTENDKEFERFPEHCVIGTEEPMIVDYLISTLKKVYAEKKVWNKRVNKTTFDGFFKTELEEIIRDFSWALVGEPAREKIVLVISGLVSEICVLYTAAGAVQRGYEVEIIRDCIFPLNERDEIYALRHMRNVLGVKII